MRRITFSVCLSVAAGGALAVSSPASAQDRCYRVIDLGPIGFSPGDAQALFGLNNNDQGVFTAEVLQKKHAMLYLPAPAYGFTEPGCYDLHELANIPADESSVAHDINESGIVAGYRTVNGERHAFIWRLDTDPHEFINLGTFDDGDSSEAFAVNDDPNPWIVGRGEYSSDCDCEGSGFAMDLAFATRLNVAELGLDFAAKLFDDPNFGCHPATRAWDINTAQVLTVAGQFGFGGGCQNGSPRATVWTNPILGQANDGTGLADLPGFGSNAWGVSNLGPIVGVAQAEQSQQHAVFWPDPGVMDPLDLATLPGIPPFSQPKAYRINNLTDIDVVGRSSGVLGVALLWECSANCDDLTNWSVVDLNDQLTSDCQSAGNWTLYRADDVNDNGLIIGSGHRQGQGAHAFILEPQYPCCPDDLDGNGIVGASDLLILLANWGSCPDCAICVADLDCNNDVGASDLTILLAAWGPCGFPIATGPPQDIQDCMTRFCCDPEDELALIKCLELVTQ